jgi:hypothetical protein
MRERLVREIIPESVRQSRTVDDNEAKNAAAHAVDLDLTTSFHTERNSEGKVWFKLFLDQLYCVEKVLEYIGNNGAPSETWTCTDKDCSKCEGRYCHDVVPLVLIRGTSATNLPPVTNCRYGDTIKMTHLLNNDEDKIGGSEIAIIGKKGEVM